VVAEIIPRIADNDIKFEGLACGSRYTCGCNGRYAVLDGDFAGLNVDRPRNLADLRFRA
jgi:hypothetical protein